jgi:hypothetical protein
MRSAATRTHALTSAVVSSLIDQSTSRRLAVDDPGYPPRGGDQHVLRVEVEVDYVGAVRPVGLGGADLMDGGQRT